MTTTTATVTSGQIRQLLTEATTAGDLEQVHICRTALGEGSDQETVGSIAWAINKCVRVIAAAEEYSEWDGTSYVVPSHQVRA